MRTTTWHEYLNGDNAWARRLLGLEPFSKRRSEDEVTREYDREKYGKLAAVPAATLEECKRAEFALAGLETTSELTVSFGEDLLRMSLDEARFHYYRLIKEVVGRYPAPRYCELGCGYGYNLSLLDGERYGGEFSANAVALGKKLGADVSAFNYYRPSDFDLIRPDSTVFTVHSLEQIPDAAQVVDNFAAKRDRIRYVVHLEPTFVPSRRTLPGLIRNRYIELNDYNRNLLAVLHGRPDVEILEERHDVMGLNPLNSTNVICWGFR